MNHKTSLALLVCGVISLLATPASARSFRLNQVPNGSKYGCALCHNNPAGGGPRNGFGAQVEATLATPAVSAAVDWAAIYDSDGDADGYSNGRELGDPDGLWTIGQPNPSGDTYAPHDRADSPCGDGVMENPPEECDGDDMPADVACEDFGWGPGTLSCSSTCRINQEACEGHTIVIPNNSNPPPNNSNNTIPPSTNNDPGTNNDTGSTNNATTGTSEDEDGGCSTSGAATPSAWWLLIGLFFARRRSRR